MCSKTTTREVIVALLRKFKVVDNPQKFALYERSYDQDATRGRSVTWSLPNYTNLQVSLANFNIGK